MSMYDEPEKDNTRRRERKTATMLSKDLLR